MAKNTNIELDVSQFEEQNKNESEDIGVNRIIFDTPFTAVKVGNMWKIIMGNEIASGHDFESYEKAKEYVDSKPWELILVGTLIYNNLVKNKEKNEE